MQTTVRRSKLQALLPLPPLVLLLTVCSEPIEPESKRTHRVSPTISVATSPPAILVGAADIGLCTGTTDDATGNLLDGIDGTVMMLGDGAYPGGTATEYTNCYTPAWGRHLPRTRPTPGDIDYKTANAPGYFGYFGAAAGTAGAGYYSYELGEWHVVVLNSNISMKVGSPQVNWLTADLKTNSRACTVAYWHHPRFYSSSTGIRSTIKPVWDVLHTYGADVVVNGNPRFYERFAPQNPDGVADPQQGIRQFINGLGGSGSNSIGTIRPNSQMRQRTDYGVLKLSLGSGTYDWEFVPIAGKTFTDRGTDVCHGELPPVARPGGPYVSEGPVAFNGSASSDPQGDALTYEWDFGDGSPTATGSAISHTYAANGSYTASLTVTDADGNVSAPGTAGVTIENQAPVVSANPGQFTIFGNPTALAFSFTDYNLDSPWTYEISWGDGNTDVGETPTQGTLSGGHSYAAPGDYTAVVSVTDVEGATGSAQVKVSVRDPSSAAILVGAGDIASCGTKPWDLNDEATGRLLDMFPTATVFTAGDNAYPDGTAVDYANCYEPGWGRHKTRTYPTLGNHEYDTGTANATFDYFGDRAGPRGLGYYSYDLGAWHIIVLNDNSSFVPFKAGTAQDLWLQNDLATNTKQCVMAMFHQPMVMSSNSTFVYRSTRKILWDRLYAAGVEVVVSGHQHFYERFAPQNPDRQRDDARGIRQFIVGTGGESSEAPTAYIAPNSELRSGAFGVMKFTLHDGGYQWEFVPIAGETFTDSGTGFCH